MNDDFIVFGAPDIGDAEIREVLDTLHSGWLGTGPKVAEFERRFAEFKGVEPERVVALNSCTAALHLSLVAAGIGPGDEVITSPLTFCATVNAILHVGARPVLVDVDPLTMNLDPNGLEACITARTKAVLPVHFAGLPCAMSEILAIARRHRLIVIEDCAHAIEASYRGRPVGTLGDFGCFSFYATKNMTTGEGGMLLAQDPEHAGRIRRLALHGMTRDAWKRFSDQGYAHYQVVEAGFKYNMMDLQAAIGIHQLARVSDGWPHRERIWNHYREAFSHQPVILPPQPPAHVRHAYHLFTLQMDVDQGAVTRDTFIERMTRAGIGVGVHYLALGEHPYYQQHLGWRPEDTPHATAIGRRTVSLPLSPVLTDEQVRRIVEAVQEHVRAI
ncbi:DegT/DnrJ/EryC1/StrS family aminotransferase [Pseudomonas sp. NPDC090202]|uniref:DegT/DnrJ/EryC1/StrS family aminotransferase n=1 Tax=unclassified Pseudomonas TaxID=196821 RepID=UPI003809351F